MAEPERKTSIEELTGDELLQCTQALRVPGGTFEMPPTEAAKSAERERQIKDGTYDHSKDASPYEMTAEQHFKRLQQHGGRP